MKTLNDLPEIREDIKQSAIDDVNELIEKKKLKLGIERDLINGKLIYIMQKFNIEKKDLK